MYKLRDEAAQLQAKLMEISHRKKLGKLRTLSKGTMTDECPSCRYCQSSISVTDSATQVDCSPHRPSVTHTAVSPIRPVLHREAATQTSAAAEKSPKSTHRRTHSEGDSLFYAKKAGDALRRVKKVSKELEEISTSKLGSTEMHVCKTGDQSTAMYKRCGDQGRREEGAPEINSQSVECVCGMVVSEHGGKNGRNKLAIHKCVFQQQVKALQKQLKTVNKQVYILH